jgi:hypothetical protein
MIAPLLLAVTLGQCPQPISSGDPPPCAAMNVRGCLPGYTPIRDRYGRVLYVCSTNPAAAAPAYGTPTYATQAYAAPAYAAPPPAPAPSTAYASPLASAPAPERGRGRLALVLAPGRTTDPAFGQHGGHDLERNAAAAGLEIRGRGGGARLRFQYQYTELGRIAELGVKYDFFEGSPLRPFIGLGAGASSFQPDTSWRASGSAFAGIDLYFDRNAFLTAEIQGRRFANHTNDGGRALEVSDRRQTSVLVGIGMFL